MGFFDFLKRKQQVIPPVQIPDNLPFIDNDHTPFPVEGCDQYQGEIVAALASTGRQAGQQERTRASVSLHLGEGRGAPIEVRLYGYIVGTVPRGEWRSLMVRRLKSAGTKHAKTVAHVVAVKGRHYVEIWPFMY